MLVAALLTVWAPPSSALVPERRSEDGANDFGWFAAPTPMVIEGVGSAVPVFGLLSNVYKSTDLIAVKTLPGGDFDIAVAVVGDLPLFTDHLQFTGGRFSGEFPIIFYNRGIDSDPDDFLQPLIRQTGTFLELKMIYWEERINIFYQRFDSDTNTLKVFDKDGNLLSSEESSESNTGLNYGVQLDLTDDPVDPRRGLRLGRKYAPIKSNVDFISDILVTDSNITGYISTFGKDTLLINLFTSTSSITRSGVTDEATAEAIMDQGCVAGSEIYEACKAGEGKLVSDFLAYNRYGQATPMGGVNRLRGYPLNRFNAGNSSYMGIEYRLNFSEEPKEINWYVLGGMKTLLQLAFFYEQGTVSEISSELTKNLKSSYGVGGRALISGFVYRLDIAMGDEGPAINLFIDYPMTLNPITN